MKNLPEKYFTIDDSLSLINRTGAFYIARELVEAFRGISRVRRWHFFEDPTFDKNLQRKLSAKLMLLEFQSFKDKKILYWPEDKNSAFTLYLDPLYVLRSDLSHKDIVLCHDIGPITNAHMYQSETVEQYQKAYQKIVTAKCGLVFVSEFSKNEFVNTFSDKFRFLQTIPLFFRNELAKITPEAVPDLHQPFFLSVGSLELRKNHALTIKAFHEGKFYEQGYQLIICGSKGNAYDEIKTLGENTPGVKLIGYVSNAKLSWLYQNAEIFILPSQYEGFGLPALEAASFGLPMVISKDTALEEAVCGLGIKVNFRSYSEIVDGINTILGLTLTQKTQLKNQLRDCANKASQTKFLDSWQLLIERELSLN